MKKTIYLFTSALLILSFFSSHTFAQLHSQMRGKEGDICYEAELAFRQHQYLDHEAMVDFKDYLNCLARQYTSGQANLYEVRMRVNNDEVDNLLVAIGELHCRNSSEPDCAMHHAVFLGKLDSDQDGLEDLHDSTPLGANPPPNVPLGDEDGDGITDDLDACQGTPTGWQINGQGCPQLIVKAVSVHSFYPFGTDKIKIIGKALQADGRSDLVNADVSYDYGNANIGTHSFTDGSFELDFFPESLPKAYSLTIEATHPDFASNTMTVNFSVRHNLGISVSTNKTDYLAGEQIYITGQVWSPEPIGSDLGIQCEIKVYDAAVEKSSPYRVQRVPLRSDGTFSYDIPIYGSDEQGKWLESGEFGYWTVIAEVRKDGESKTDLKVITVFRTHVDQNKAIREYWGRQHAKTAQQTQSFDRPSHGESILLGSNTEVVFTQSEQVANLIKVIEGEILYLKKMRQKLSDAQKELLQGNPDHYISMEGQYTQCTSVNSSYILEVDPATGTDKVTVFYGPIAISSSTGAFPTFEVERATEVLINAEGIQEKRSLSKRDQWDAGQAFVAALGGTNPADLRHISDAYADELDPNYEPGLVEMLEDYALYIIVGGVSLVILILLFRRMGKGKAKVEASAKIAAPIAPKKETSKSEWEAARFCTNCGAVMPKSAKFCPSCGADQV